MVGMGSGCEVERYGGTTREGSTGDEKARGIRFVSFKVFPALKDRNLVDPASSHTLVSKIKPCMCKCKCSTLELRMAHYISYSLFGEVYYLDNRSNSRANT